MTPQSAEAEFARLVDVCESDPESATSIERGLFTSVAMAVQSRDFERAYELSKLALNAQEVPFRRC